MCGLGNSYFEYGGDYRWSAQEDMFDLSQVTALIMELAAAGHLVPPLTGRLKKLARGHRPRGYSRQEHAMSVAAKARAYIALGRIAIVGR